MIKAVLVDLDDTLLINADKVFVPEYLRLIDAFIEERWQYPQISHVLRQYIQAATGLRDPRQSISDLAESVIAAATGRSSDEIRTTFADFYAHVYPQLQDCIEQVPLAPRLIDALQRREYAVVIATNPLYPAEAIRQRLAWAGLPDDLTQYALVTHSENMHFTKPDPAYYAEIIARVGVEPDEALMIGDNIDNDIEPAAKLGLYTYLICPTPAVPSPQPASYTGTLDDFFARVTRQDWPSDFAHRIPGPQAIEPQLRGNMGALAGLLTNVAPQHWLQHPDPDEWSIMEIVCHLLQSETTVQLPRLQRILAEDNPFLSPPRQPPGPGEVPSCYEDGYQAANRFIQCRQETIQWLAQLQPQDWHRPARHSIFGPTTLLEMAHFTAQHDRLHLNQLCQTLGRCQEK